MSVASFFTLAVGTAVDIFYRRRLLAGGGHIPATGPILVVANHPNGLMDPVVIQNSLGKLSGRRLRSLAKAPLFKMPLVSLIIKGMDAIPVYRAQDGADTSQNEAMFSAVEQALCSGSAVLLFPEGVSHDEPAIQPLKTGAARMALRAVAAGAHELVIIPVGLSYADKLRFRSTAAVEIGHPIAAQTFLGLYQEDPRQAVHQLTQTIADGLAQVTINLEHWEDLPILEAIDAIWRISDPERVRRLRSLALATSQLRQTQLQRYDDLRSRLSDWLLRINRYGLKPQDLAPGAEAARSNPGKVLLFTARNLFALLFGLPIAMWGALFWGVPFWTVHLIWILWRAERDVGATVKVLASLVLFPLWYLLVLLLSWKGLPLWWWLLLAIVSPASGMFTRHFFRRRFYAIEQLATYLQLSFQGRLRQSLLEERDKFCAEFDEIAQLIQEPTK